MFPFFLKSYIDDILSHLLWAVLQILKPPSGGEVNCVMTRLYHDISGHKAEYWPQRNGNKLTLKLKINCLIKMMQIGLLMTNFMMTVKADCAISARDPFLCLQKLLPTDCVVSRGIWPLDRCLPYPLVAGSKIKQTFLSTNLASLLAFERWAARPHLLITLWPRKGAVFALGAGLGCSTWKKQKLLWYSPHGPPFTHLKCIIQ